MKRFNISSFAATIFYALFFFPVYIACAYVLMNIILPVYFFRNRYIPFFLWMTGIIVIAFVACSLSGMLYIHYEWSVPYNKITFNTDKYNIVVNALFFPLTILGISGGIKIAKNWYYEQRENERLAKEKITRELQLLKTQLHPRFLFYSLHTIKKNIALHPLLASELILQLSDLLSYILYESDREWVSLEKEIEIVRNYVELQQKSRGGKLDIQVDISGVVKEKYIFPLLLLSFIENIFDFVMKENQKHPSLKLDITVWDKRLDYILTCNHFINKLQDPLEVKQQFFNLEKQLRFIYPDTHRLMVESDEENMTITISLPLLIIKAKEDAVIKDEIHELL